MWRQYGTKYNNRRVSFEGKLYDSQLEAHDAMWLQSLEKRGVIQELERQIKVPLVVNGVTLRHYLRVDFRYRCGKWTVLHETKGMPTDGYKVKREVLEAMLKHSPDTKYLVNPQEKELLDLL